PYNFESSYVSAIDRDETTQLEDTQHLMEHILNIPSTTFTDQGIVYEHYSNFPDRVNNALRELYGDYADRINIGITCDCNDIGAALAAMLASTSDKDQ
ncbi:hypothetical protein CU098_011864, partial [Rhizopus stolonifer]